MKLKRINVFAIAALAAATGLSACSFSANTSLNKPAETNKPTTTVNTTTNTSTPKSADSSTSDVAGTYTVDGKGSDGKDYKGELLVTKRDAVYQMSWTIGDESYDGVAVQKGNALAASYTTGKDGKGCGAVVYSVSDDGELDGIWGEWGVNSSGTEKAVQVGETKGAVGTFDASGTNPNGTAYKGKLTITQGANDVYQFDWATGTNYKGTGVRMGDHIAAGSGSKQCGFVIYEVKGNTLDGKWGVPGSTSLGTEKATKK